jgi:hypothetical protein
MTDTSTSHSMPETMFNAEVRKRLDAKWMTIADMDQDALDNAINADWHSGCTPHEAAFNIAVSHNAN